MRYTREMFLNLESVFFGMASNANKRFLMLGMKTACFKFNLNSPHQVFLSLIINKVARLKLKKNSQKSIKIPHLFKAPFQKLGAHFIDRHSFIK